MEILPRVKQSTTGKTTGHFYRGIISPSFLITNHGEDVEEMRKETEQGVDREFKLFMGQLFGFMQKHLEKALETQKAIGVQSSI